MRRAALLIEASKAKGQKVIDGCVRDVERIKRWLSNPSGGAWEEAEIRILRNPSKADVLAARQVVDVADFGLVTFSGHGYIVEDASGHRTQMVTLGTGDDMPFLEMKPNASKSIISCDACRNILRPSQIWLSTNARAVLLEKFAEAYSRQSYRDYFEKAVASAPPGVFTMYSCAAGQEAGEDPLNGGTFTDALLRTAASWYAEATVSSVLTIDAALERVKPMVSKVSRDKDPTKPQNPNGGPSNRSAAGNPYPFGVVLK